MRVLVLGGTRFVGREVARAALSAGHEVSVFNPGSPEKETEGGLEELSERRADLLRLRPEVVVHGIAPTEAQAAASVGFFKGSGAKVIVLSSQDVYAARTKHTLGLDGLDFPISEPPPAPPPPRRHVPGRLRPHDDAAEHVILRLPRVYGPGDPLYALRHGAIVRRILDRRKAFPLGLCRQGRLVTYGYVKNVAAAVVHAFGPGARAGRVYHIGEGQVRTQRKWAELFAREAGWSFDFAALPDELLPADPLGRRGPGAHLICDCSSFCRDTGFQEPVPLQTSIQQTLEWGLKNPQVLGEAPDYGREDRLIASYAELLGKLRG